MKKCYVTVAIAASLICAAANADDQRPKFNVAAKSIPGTIQTCKGSASECLIVVRVTSECMAIVDTETIRIKKNIPVRFVLVRSDMTDTQTYKFLRPGIVWSPTTPTANEIYFVQLSTGDTVAEWKTGNKKSTADRGYLPLVQRDSDKQVCSAGDPKIANDG